MARKRWTRKDLKQPDQFVAYSHRVGEFVQARVMPVGVGLVAAVLVLGGASVWAYLRAKAARAGTELLGRALVTYGQPLLDAAEAAESSEEHADEPPRFPTVKERAEAVLRQLDGLAQKDGRLDEQAELLRASCRLDLDRVDEAAGSYRRFLDETDGRNPLRWVALEGLGYVLERKGKLDEALAQFKGMLGALPRDNDPRRARAHWHMGRLHARLGDKEEARRAYRLILEKFPTSPLRAEAEGRLAALDE